MKRTFKRNKLITFGLGALCVAAAGVIGANANALVDTPWGPDRPTFTWDNPAPYATFNSITDNPQLGDERNFVRIREVKEGEYFGDEVAVEPGKTYEVYIYYHNNADAHDVGKTAIGIADGASVQSSFPATVKAGEKATVTGKIFASDTEPLAVWDGAYITSTQDVYLRYVPGTATIHNGGELDGASIGPDYLFGDGALLGYNKFSGVLPGCNEYAGYITYQIFADAPGFSVTKSVVGDNTTVKAGDTVTFKVRYENTGTMDQKNVVVRDTLSDKLEYVAGSTMLYNNNLTEGKVVNDDIFTEHGMSIGDYAGGNGWAEVVYKAMVKKDVKCGDTISNNAIVSTTDGNKEANVTLKLEGCKEDDEDKNKDPVPDDKKTCATNPEMEGCKELPNTGPLEITIACLILLGIIGGGFYFYRSKKTLNKVEAGVSGKDTSKSASKDAPKAASPATPKEETKETVKDSSQKPDNMVK